MNGDDVTSKPNGFIFVIPPFSGVMITLNGRMLAATQIHTDRYTVTTMYRDEKNGWYMVARYFFLALLSFSAWPCLAVA